MAYRREWATRAGATATVDAEADPVGEVQSLTNGVLADVVVEASGTAGGINLALELARFGGSMLSFGITEDAVIPVNYTAFTRREVNIIPSRSASTPAPAQSIRGFVGLVERGWTDLSWMVTHRMTVNDVDQVYAMYDKRDRESLKIVMEM